MIEKYIQALREYALSHDSNFADGETVLGMQYYCFADARAAFARSLHNAFLDRAYDTCYSEAYRILIRGDKPP